jgi:hypothetical protein
MMMVTSYAFIYISKRFPFNFSLLVIDAVAVVSLESKSHGGVPIQSHNLLEEE